MLAPTFFAALLANCSAADEAGQIAHAEASLTGTTSIEKSVLVLAGSRARREGKALVLLLDNGNALRLTDNENCVPDDPEHADCPSYTLEALLPSRGVFVVMKQYDEADDFILVDMANGHRHTVDGPPHFSPDGKRFLTCRADEMNCGGATIWRIASGRYVQEWHDDRMSVCGRWRDNDSVGIGVYDAEPTGQPRATTLVHKGEAWQLRE